MAFDNLTEFHGRPVKDWEVEDGVFDFAAYTPRLRVEYDSDDYEINTHFKSFLEKVDVSRVTALVFGLWGDYDSSSASIVKELVEAKLPALEALFLGDMAQEENEVSWINQSDLSPLWGAYPGLRELGIRGSNGLVVGQINLPKLERLVIETGGLPRQVVTDVLNASLPALTHLEVLLGIEDYGGDNSVGQFKDLMLANMPALKSLGLCNCQYADDLARILANAPVISRIERLDLSRGTLGDEGAEALLASPAVKALKELDLHWHYMSDAVMEKFAGFSPKLDLSEQQEEEDYGRHPMATE